MTDAESVLSKIVVIVEATRIEPVESSDDSTDRDLRAFDSIVAVLRDAGLF